eukprot:6397032-Pyramimonas_sp.AAC.1
MDLGEIDAARDDRAVLAREGDGQYHQTRPLRQHSLPPEDDSWTELVPRRVRGRPPHRRVPLFMKLVLAECPNYCCCRRPPHH